MATFLTPLKNMNAGEKRVATFLNTSLDDEHLIWFDIPTQGTQRRFPDFLIFHPRYGLISLEVKNWTWRNLHSLNQNQIQLKQNDTLQTRTHPLKQARDCLLPIIKVLQKDPQLLRQTEPYKGHLALPWGYGAIMSNWKRLPKDHPQIDAIEKCFPDERTFYQEDLDLKNIDPQAFREKLYNLLPFIPERPLSKAQSERIRAHIFPEFIIKQQFDLFSPNAPAPSLPDLIHVMDTHQETLARTMGDGHRVIHGVSGSGKTVLLKHRARVLAKQTTPEKPVLVVCFNIVLAQQLKTQLNDERIHVYHFHGWCMTLRDQYNLKITGNKAYYHNLADSICQAIENKQIPHHLYHAVLIDEGHDFAEHWLKSLTYMPDPAHNHLLLLYDDTQSIYDNRRGINFTLSSVGIKAVGRTSILRINYRNSREILTTADQFVQHFLNQTDSDDDSIPILAPQSSGNSTGIEPQFYYYDSQTQELNGVLTHLQQWLDKGISAQNIAILYTHNDFARALHKHIEAQNIPVQFLLSQKDKSAYNNSKSTITLCSIASSKGSEYSHVILTGIGQCPDDSQRSQYVARLIYVGMTRATHRLILTASQSNTFTHLLEE